MLHLRPSILLIPLLLLLGSGVSLEAQETTSTVRKRGLRAIVHHLRGVVATDLQEGPVTVGLLLDQGELFRKHQQGEGLARAWEEVFSPALPAPLRVVVAACGIAQPVPLGEPTLDDAVRTAENLRLQGPDYEDIPNLMANIRALARGMAPVTGRRHLVLVSLDWVDAEEELERTRKALQATGVTLHIIGRGAYLSDSYWAGYQPTSATVRKHHLALTGADAPFRELPVGWIFDRHGFNEQPPSGFGPYAFSRLCGATGGSYYLHFPSTPSQSFCQITRCLLCGGNHEHCDRYFNESFLRQLAPPVGARSETQREALADPLVKATLRAWDLIEDAECLQTRPPFKQSGAPIKLGRSARFRASLLKATTCHSRVRWVERTVPKLEKALAVLDSALEAQRSSPAASLRALANAELVQARLLATLLNLDQFRIFNETVDREFTTGTGPTGPESSLVPEDARSCCVMSYNVRTITFCHGVDPVREIAFLAGERSRQLLERTLAAVQRNLERYHHTPWELASRRIVLAAYLVAPPST